jgi:hypothetical protein
MKARATEVSKDGSVGAAGFFEGVGEDEEAVRIKLAAGHLPLIVGRSGQGDNDGRSVGGIERDGAEGVGDDITEQGDQDRFLPLLRVSWRGARGARVGLPDR